MSIITWNDLVSKRRFDQLDLSLEVYVKATTKTVTIEEDLWLCPGPRSDRWDSHCGQIYAYFHELLLSQPFLAMYTLHVKVYDHCEYAERFLTLLWKSAVGNIKRAALTLERLLPLALRRWKAAKLICCKVEAAWCNPATPLCIARLLREFNELQAVAA
jgi:hypothetical protein